MPTHCCLTRMDGRRCGPCLPHHSLLPHLHCRFTFTAASPSLLPRQPLRPPLSPSLLIRSLSCSLMYLILTHSLLPHRPHVFLPCTFPLCCFTRPLNLSVMNLYRHNSMLAVITRRHVKDSLSFQNDSLLVHISLR